MSLEEVIKHPAHLFFQAAFSPRFPASVAPSMSLTSSSLAPSRWFQVFIFNWFSRFFPKPTLTACLNPLSPPSDAADSSSDVSSLAPLLGPCPDLGTVLGRLEFSECHMAQAFFHGVVFNVSYWIWNQTWIWTVRGSGILFFPIFGIWKHIVLDVKKVFYSAL